MLIVRICLSIKKLASYGPGYHASSRAISRQRAVNVMASMSKSKDPSDLSCHLVSTTSNARRDIVELLDIAPKVCVPYLRCNIYMTSVIFDTLYEL